MTQEDFARSQWEFLNKNNHVFEDTEENKLEYTSIYKDYVYILDQMIEQQLMQTFSKAEIDGFYETFTEKLEDYKKINPEVVDTLFGFIDFEQFKKAMLNAKHLMDEKYAESTNSSSSVDDEKTPETEQMWNQLVKEDLKDPQLGWRLALESNDKEGFSAVFHQRSMPGKKLNMVRVDAVYKNVSIEAFNEIGHEWEKY